MVGGEGPLGLDRGDTWKTVIGYDSSGSNTGRRRRKHDDGGWLETRDDL